VFTLAHLSDPHLPMPRTPWRELIGKRATGYFNWWRNRADIHVPEALAGIVADIKQQHPDHIALTGDLVNVSLPEEFRRAAEWLKDFDSPDRMTVIPGNHDAYVPYAWNDGAGQWSAYMTGDGAVPPSGPEDFPFLRRRGEVAFVGLTTGVPKPPLLATGDLGPRQIERAERMLAELGREDLYRVVLIHHPPLTTESRMKWLTDAADFQAMIARVGCELILHGHNHRTEVGRVAGPQGQVPVLGVTSASAAIGSKYDRARYHLIRITREADGWKTGVEVRALKADLTGCEPDGQMVFHSRGPHRSHSSAAAAMVD
jgi:3',5'-cyclic AMP phosphodiesterase CpdA